MVGVEAVSSSVGAERNSDTKRSAPVSPRQQESSSTSGQQMEAGDVSAEEWAEQECGFAIPTGTLGLVQVKRSAWRRPVELPLQPPSPTDAPILQEFSRPWRALCLPIPPTPTEEPKGGRSIRDLALIFLSLTPQC
jgi:hypothetical protein